MTEFWLILICDLLVPVVMILAGIILWRLPPREINGLFGYRTNRSMRSKEAWKFAQKYSGKLLAFGGAITLVITPLLHLPFINASVDELGILCGAICTVQIALLFLAILLTERMLKKHFPDEGEKKINKTK